jgi:hypothetical protein
VAAQVGYCGLDRRRLPLSGLELRGCWAAGPVRAADAIPVSPAALEGAEPPSPALRLRDFVPIELARRDASTACANASTARVPEPSVAGGSAVPDTPESRPDAVHGTADRVTLFVDAEL